METQGMIATIGLIKEANENGIRVILNNGELQLKFDRGHHPDQSLIEKLRTEKESLRKYFELTGTKKDSAKTFSITSADPLEIDGMKYYDINNIQRYWIDDAQDEAYKNADNVHGKTKIIYRITGDLAVESLIYALKQLVERHELLRATFHSIDGELKLRVEPADKEDYIPVYEKIKFDTDVNPVDHLFNTWSLQGFDNALFRSRIVQTDDGQYFLVIHVSHAIVDGWAIDVLIEDLFAIYRQHVQNNSTGLPRLPFRYMDFVSSAERHIKQHRGWQKKRWANKFEKLPPITLLSGKTGTGKPIQERRFRFMYVAAAAETLISIKKLAAIHQCTPFTILQSVFRKFLLKHTGRGDVLLGTYTLGREYPGTERMVGCFAKTNLLCVQLSEQDELAQVIRAVMQHEKDTAEMQACSLREYLETILPSDHPTGAPFWNINIQFSSVTHQNIDAGSSEIRDFVKRSGLVFERMPYQLNDLINLDAEFLFALKQDELLIECRYDGSTFDENEIHELLNSFRHYLADTVL
ncbi:MAG: condensation domain-containing protein [Chitinophagaceae bacterium]